MAWIYSSHYPARKWLFVLLYFWFGIVRIVRPKTNASNVCVFLYLYLYLCLMYIFMAMCGCTMCVDILYVLGFSMRLILIMECFGFHSIRRRHRRSSQTWCEFGSGVCMWSSKCFKCRGTICIKTKFIRYWLVNTGQQLRERYVAAMHNKIL